MFMKVAHHSRSRAVGLVPMYLRASRTSAGQPVSGAFGGAAMAVLRRRLALCSRCAR